MIWDNSDLKSQGEKMTELERNLGVGEGIAIFIFVGKKRKKNMGRG